MVDFRLHRVSELLAEVGSKLDAYSQDNADAIPHVLEALRLVNQLEKGPLHSLRQLAENT